MPDPFSGATTAIQLADISFRVYSSLAKFVNDTKTADTAARALQDKVRALWTTVSNINSVVRVRDESVEHGHISTEEVQIREKLSKDISACHRILQAFEVSLDGLLKEAHPSWLGKSLLQLQLNKRDGAIKRLENVIDTRLQMLQVSLACMEVLTNVDNHQQVMRHLINLSSEIKKSQENWSEFKRTQQQVTEQTAPDIRPVKSTLAEEDLQKLGYMIDADEQSINGEYEELIAEASEIQRSTAGSMKGLTDSGDGLSSGPVVPPPSRPRRGTAEIPPAMPLPSIVPIKSITPENARPFDPNPGFDDTTHLEPLDLLIERFSRKAREDWEQKRHNRAEAHQREAIALLEERQLGYGQPFDNYEEMQSFLAEILTDQKKYDDSDRIRFALLDGQTVFSPPDVVNGQSFAEFCENPERALSMAKQYQRLAQGTRKRYLDEPTKSGERERYLRTAEWYAKRAFKCRRHFLSPSDPDLVATAELLAQIYRDLMMPIYAETYAQQYLTGQAAARLMSFGSVSPRSSVSKVDTTAPNLPMGPASTDARSEMTMDPRDSVMDSPHAALRPTFTWHTELFDEAGQASDKGSLRKSILEAVRTGDDRRLLALLDQAGSSPRLTNLALWEAARVGTQQMTGLMLEQDAQPNAFNDMKQNSLQIAAESGHLTVVQQLLDAHADPDLAGADGWTAIHFAVHKDRRDVLKTLLNHTRRADVNAKCAYGNTGLHAAAEQGNFEIAYELLRAEADSSIENSGNFTALEVAIDCRQVEFIRAWLAEGYPNEVRWDKMTGISTYIRDIIEKHAAAQVGGDETVERHQVDLSQVKSGKSQAGSLKSQFSTKSTAARRLKSVFSHKTEPS